MSTPQLLDAAGRRRSPATVPGFHAGRPPRNKGFRYPPDPPRVEEIIAVMRQAGESDHGLRLRAPARRRPAASRSCGVDMETSLERAATKPVYRPAAIPLNEEDEWALRRVRRARRVDHRVWPTGSISYSPPMSRSTSSVPTSSLRWKPNRCCAIRTSSCAIHDRLPIRAGVGC